MKTACRLVKKAHERDAFSGEGARRYGGRWNHRGTAVVYLSDSLALAALEVFVHLGAAHRGLVFATFRVELPDAVIETLSAAALPGNWREEPPPDVCKDVGTNWVQSGRCAVLDLPSVVVPTQRSYVVNVAHVDFAKLKVEQQDDFSFDPRMSK